ncbi:MAG TPA: tetratricopeptide repeat protein [Vicinamibacterales bacterium]|nr:tetratricopeptide repeat protein [Vicinamibacterales bacterium]
MAIDRALTLRNAEKLIRQGKLDAGISEYLRVVEDAPGDWNAKNTLGDLYARAGKTDKAIEQFLAIADNLSEEGSNAKAGAVFKKILKLKPDHEHALMQVADILGNQRLYADARAHLNTLIELRRARGDTRGALQAKIRLGSLDPEDYEGRLAAANARIEMGDKGGAMSDFKEIAGELAEKGRQQEAIEVLREAAKLNPNDEELRERLFDVHFAAGDLVRARECANAVEQFRTIAAAFEGQGQADEALETLRQAAAHDSLDTELKAELARAYVARGDLVTAAEYLTAETAGDDPELLLTLADIKLRGESFDEGLAIARRLLEQDGSRRDRIAQLGWTVAERHPEAGFQVVELAADSAVAQNDWGAAAAALQEFVTRVPNHIPALMRLVEICVDGGLEATMYSAQSQLADAYIAAGAATEARFIAEDLVAREPWDRANLERFRRALELSGEPDPDALIAARLSGESPFTSTDFLLAGGDTPLFNEKPGENANPEATADPLPEIDDLLAAAASSDEPASKKKSRAKVGRKQHEEHHFQLSANAIDLESILGELDSPSTPPPTAHAKTEDVEVDLSLMLEDIKHPPPDVPKGGGSEPADLDGVFADLRGKAGAGASTGAAEQAYVRGLALREAGDIDGCLAAMQEATHSPRLRFVTGAVVARIFRERGQTEQAIEWFERATQAPAPTKEESHQLMYDFAETLEAAHEVIRALAVCLELQADAGDYKDVAARIDRLTKVQAGG